MESRKQELALFFNEYAKRFNKAIDADVVDAEETALAFADCFIESSPNGVICGKNDDEFRKAIPEGYKFYKKIGITSMDIINKDITHLDPFHDIVRIHWSSSFIKKDNSTGNIEFDVIYLVRTIDGVQRIFAYITGDEQAALKEKGLVGG